LDHYGKIIITVIYVDEHDYIITRKHDSKFKWQKCKDERSKYYLFAIDNIPAPVCFSSLVSSSSNVGLKTTNWSIAIIVNN
jgi:predicted transporter